MVTHIYHGNTHSTLVIKYYLLYYSVSIIIESDSIPFRHFSKKNNAFSNACIGLI